MSTFNFVFGRGVQGLSVVGDALLFNNLPVSEAYWWGEFECRTQWNDIISYANFRDKTSRMEDLK